MIRILLLICLFAQSLQAQPQLTSYDNSVNHENIRSVRFHVNGLALTQPITTLGSMESLTLSFDELDGQGTRYYYTVIHCDRNWNPTQELTHFDYMTGFREAEIRDYEISSGTYQNYLHYTVAIPNKELSWSVTGNYLLVVYESGNEENPAITRRFMVTEEKMVMYPRVIRPAVVTKQTTHQEIDFTIDTKEVRSMNPRLDFSCTILQNGRWDNCLKDIVPRLLTGTLLDYNYQDKIVFPAGKEFRFLDISSMIYRSENVLDIEEYTDGYSTILVPDEPRARQAYLFRRDLNGMFVPFNRDYYHKEIPLDALASTLNLVDRYNYREQQLNTEYTEVIFTLRMPEDIGEDIYIVGGMTDWKLLPEYKMSYDDRVGAFICRGFLKQGYYNYGYAVPDAEGRPDFSYIEGDWYSTENQYTLLMYFRPRGGLYDQLVGILGFNSNQ